jgi:hypothetical protein
MAWSFRRNMVFVIMPFRATFHEDKIYAVIKKQCAKLKLKTYRSDELIGAETVIDNVKKYIIDCEFVICDLSAGRPNVYYELGYAHGVGNKALDILLLARKGSRIHFDIAPLQIRFYNDARELRSILARDLVEMIRQTRGRAPRKVSNR